MKTVKFAALLLLLSLLLSSCIQISFPQNRPSEDSDSEESGETDTDTEAVTLPKEPMLNERGSVSSTESDSVILRTDWRAVSFDGKTAEVTVSVYISYSKLSKGKSTGEVTLNGETKRFSVKAIVNETNSKATINPANLTFTVTLDPDTATDLVLETTWELDKTVDGKLVETLNASAEFPLWSGRSNADDDLDAESGSKAEDAEKGTPSGEGTATPRQADEPLSVGS